MLHNETGLQKSIVKYLRLKGYILTSSGAGLIKSRNTQMVMGASGYMVGSADLMVFIPNGCVHIEIKRPAVYEFSAKSRKNIIKCPAGKQSDAQKEFEKRITSLPGHYYLVAYSLQDVIDFFKSKGI